MKKHEIVMANLLTPNIYGEKMVKKQNVAKKGCTEKLSALFMLLLVTIVSLASSNIAKAQPGGTPPYYEAPILTPPKDLLDYSLPFIALNPAPTTSVNPCTSCCKTTPWASTRYDDFRLSNGCIIRVFYTWRKACNTWYEAQVLEIRQLNTHCNNYSKAQLFNEAHRAIIALNRMNFPLDEDGDCIIEYKVSSATCWTTWELYSYIEGQLIDISIDLPCIGVSSCCEAVVKVCKENGKFIFTDLSNNIEWGDCAEDGEPPSYPEELPACHAVCGWYKLSEYLPVALEKENLNDRGEVNSIKIEKQDNSLTFEILNFEENADLSISIVDVTGREVQTINKNLDMLYNSIQTQKFDRGIYLYNIYVGGRLLHSNKVMFE